MLGLENHLNLFHENRRGLPEPLARGLAVFLNTTAVDEHFSRYNGHSQFNATDLKLMKYPSRGALIQPGTWSCGGDLSPGDKMQRRYNQFNTKRRIKKLAESDLQHCSDLAEQVRYGGNPEHKKDPGDFGLTPPSGPRPEKSLCDAVDIFSRQDALNYLKSGLRRGLISDRFNGRWPQNIWSLTEDGNPLEAQLENPEMGTYHGYPMPQSDPLAAEIVRRWNKNNG
jgi:hypothetical protein